MNETTEVKKKYRWYLKPFPCACETKYWFEVTEMEVPDRLPKFKENREYLYYCHACKKNKVVTYKFDDLDAVEVPDDN